MPHVLVKMKAGRTEEQKKLLTEALAQAVTSSLGCKPEVVSIAIEDVAAERWESDVYVPDIVGKQASLYRRPGYGSLS